MAQNTKKAVQKPLPLPEDAFRQHGDHAILFGPAQARNPALRGRRHVHFVLAKTAPADFLLARDVGVLFISLRFHRRDSRYIERRLQTFRTHYRTRILLCLVDENAEDVLTQMNELALKYDSTLLCATSNIEVLRYLESLKRFAHNDSIRGDAKNKHKADDDAIFGDVLRVARGINKNDIAQISDSFNSFAEVVKAPRRTFAEMPGMGPKKVARLMSAFSSPFLPDTDAAGRTTKRAKTRLKFPVVTDSSATDDSQSDEAVVTVPASESRSADSNTDSATNSTCSSSGTGN